MVQVKGSSQVGLNVFEGRLLNNVLLSSINDIILLVLCLISQVDGPADLALQVAKIRVGNYHPAAEYALEGSTLLRFCILVDVGDLDSIKNDLNVFCMNRIPSIWVLNFDLIHLEGLICVGKEKVIARTQGQIVGELSFLRQFDASEARTI
jgi:hypothetical protein